MFEVQRPAAVSTPQDNYIQPNLSHGLRIWWAFWWPNALISLALAIVLNVALRLVWENTSAPGWLIGPVMKYDVYFFTYAVAFFVMWYILRKNFRHFRIGLLSNFGDEGAEVLRVTPRRVFRVWWTYSWRSLVYRIIVLVVVSFPLSWVIDFIVIYLKANAYVASAVMGILEGIALDAAVGLFVIYSNILDEDISDFRVALMPRAAHVAANSVPAPSSAPPDIAARS